MTSDGPSGIVWINSKCYVKTILLDSYISCWLKTTPHIRYIKINSNFLTQQIRYLYCMVFNIKKCTWVFLQKMISKTFLVTFPILVVLCHKSSAQYAPAPPGVNPQLYQQQQQVNKWIKHLQVNALYIIYCLTNCFLLGTYSSNTSTAKCSSTITLPTATAATTSAISTTATATTGI